MKGIKPLNKCMYCGAKESLTDEHIIPYAIWGHLVLPKSSCKTCAEITSKIERKSLKGFMQDMRTVANSPSRRKNKRPKSVQRNLLYSDGMTKEKYFNPKNTYSILTVPMFSRASIFGGAFISNGINVIGHEQLSFGKDISQFISENNAQGIEGIDSIDVISFARLLAKIAYGLAIVEHGSFPLEESPLIPIILNQSHDVGFWVGSLNSSLSSSNSESKHSYLTKSNKYNFSSVQTKTIIQLFENSGLSAFEVAVRVPDWKNIRKLA